MNTKELAAACRAWRIDEGKPQSVIADTAGVSVQAVSQFESGRCTSLRIYCAYLSHGFTLENRLEALEAFGEVLGNGKTET